MQRSFVVVVAVALVALGSCKPEAAQRDAPGEPAAPSDTEPRAACDASKLDSGLRTMFPGPAVAAACELPEPMRQAFELFLRPLPGSTGSLPRVEQMLETGWPVFAQACEDLDAASEALCMFGRGEGCSEPYADRLAAFRKRCQLPDPELFTARESAALTITRELLATAVFRWLKADGGLTPPQARHAARELVEMVAECAVAAPSEPCARALQSRILYRGSGNIRGSRSLRLPLSRSDFRSIERTTLTLSKLGVLVGGREVADVSCTTPSGAPCTKQSLEQAGNRFAISPSGLGEVRKALAATAAKHRADSDTEFLGILHARIDAALPYGLVADVVEAAGTAGFPSVKFTVLSQDSWLDEPVRELPVYRPRVLPTKAEPPPGLVVLLGRDGFDLRIAGSHRATAGDLIGAIPLGDDGYRFYELYNRMRALQKLLYGDGDVPFHHQVTVLAGRDARWQTVVHTIDAIRSPLEGDRYDDARSYAAAPLHTGRTAMRFQVALAVTE